MEEDTSRDEHGRLLPGHKGLKPRGANNRLQGEIKKKITEFLTEKLETLEEIYSEVSAKDKLKFLAELMGYVLPKSKEILFEENNLSQSATIDYTRLSEGTLKEILQATTIKENEND